MAVTISDIRFDIEERVEDTISNANVIQWCNDAQMDFLLAVDIPDTTTIAVDTSTLKYAIPADFKRLSKLWLQSEYDAGVYKTLEKLYEISNGYIYFTSYFSTDDTLNMDYYRTLTHFDAVTDTIDLKDSFKALYVAYGTAQYYDLPQVVQKAGEANARRRYEANMARYAAFKDQVSAFYTLQSPTGQIQGVW